MTGNEEIHCNIFTVHIVVDYVLHRCWKSICEEEIVVLYRRAVKQAQLLYEE